MVFNIHCETTRLGTPETRTKYQKLNKITQNEHLDTIHINDTVRNTSIPHSTALTCNSTITQTNTRTCTYENDVYDTNDPFEATTTSQYKRTYTTHNTAPFILQTTHHTTEQEPP